MGPPDLTNSSGGMEIHGLFGPDGPLKLVVQGESVKNVVLPSCAARVTMRFID
jgi:hypothetical protein